MIESYKGLDKDLKLASKGSKRAFEKIVKHFARVIWNFANLISREYKDFDESNRYGKSKSGKLYNEIVEQLFSEVQGIEEELKDGRSSAVLIMKKIRISTEKIDKKSHKADDLIDDACITDHKGYLPKNIDFGEKPASALKFCMSRLLIDSRQEHTDSIKRSEIELKELIELKEKLKSSKDLRNAILEIEKEIKSGVNNTAHFSIKEAKKGFNFSCYLKEHNWELINVILDGDINKESLVKLKKQKEKLDEIKESFHFGGDLKTAKEKVSVEISKKKALIDKLRDNRPNPSKAKVMNLGKCILFELSFIYNLSDDEIISILGIKESKRKDDKGKFSIVNKTASEILRERQRSVKELVMKETRKLGLNAQFLRMYLELSGGMGEDCLLKFPEELLAAKDLPYPEKNLKRQEDFNKNILDEKYWEKIRPSFHKKISRLPALKNQSECKIEICFDKSFDEFKKAIKEKEIPIDKYEGYENDGISITGENYLFQIFMRKSSLSKYLKQDGVNDTQFDENQHSDYSLDDIKEHENQVYELEDYEDHYVNKELDLSEKLEKHFFPKLFRELAKMRERSLGSEIIDYIFTEDKKAKTDFARERGLHEGNFSKYHNRRLDDFDASLFDLQGEQSNEELLREEITKMLLRCYNSYSAVKEHVDGLRFKL